MKYEAETEETLDCSEPPQMKSAADDRPADSIGSAAVPGATSPERRDKPSPISSDSDGGSHHSISINNAGIETPAPVLLSPSSGTPQEAGEQHHQGEPPPFSVFTRPQKRWIAWMTSFGAMFSTLNSYIYFPATEPMARDLGTSVSLINLTITCYLVMAGLAPAFMGDLADHEGRRPAYLLMAALMVGSNIGLALQRSYAVLFVLRMVQSAGSSGTFGAAHGVVSDIAPVAERGSYTGTLILFFGPVISGALTQRLGWPWIFWFLTILTGTHGLLYALFVPETQRKLVGDGSRPVRGVLYRNLFSAIASRHNRRVDRTNQQPASPRTHHFPNPLASLRMLRDRGTLACVTFGAITYAAKMTLQASLGAQCITIYGLDDLQAGLVYLPAGVGGAMGAKIGGLLIDRHYRRLCSRLDGEFVRGEDLSDFPIERARLRRAYFMQVVSAVGIVGYGLVLMTKTHISVMLVLQFIVSYVTSSIFAMSNTLLTDLNPAKSATVRGASNFVRCLLAGGCIAAMQPIANAIGLGWCFGIFAVLQLLGVPVTWIIQRHGLRWREERAARMAADKQKVEMVRREGVDEGSGEKNGTR